MHGLIRLPKFEVHPELSRYTTQELVAALLQHTADEEAHFGPLAEWPSLLSIELERRSDLHDNRLSRKRLRDVFAILSEFSFAQDVDFRGITVVEFGCGGLNPLSQLLVYVMLGAEKAVGIDMDSIQDPQIAAIALYRTASWMLTDPQSIVGQRPVPEPGAMIRNIRGIDLPALATGDLAEGLGDGPLKFVQNSLYELEFEPGSADLVISNSFLEHLPDCELAVEFISKLTKPGGYSTHGIDGFDHEHYADGRHPLEFLKLETEEPLVGSGGCNRMRPLEYVPLFERYDFEVLEVQRWPNGLIDLSTIDRDQFVPRFRDLPDEMLAVGRAGIYCRKKRRT